MSKMERRVKLVGGKQRQLFFKAMKEYGSIRKFSQELDVPYSTMKGYFGEVNLLPENLFNRILDLLSIEKENLEISYLGSNWGAIIGGKRGIRALEAKYPKKIVEWRKSAIKKARKKSPVSQLKKIIIPQLNEKLAEFIGVYLGDGTLTKYFIKISGDCRYDKPYFLYLKRLIFDLFGLDSNISKDRRSNTMNLVVFSKELCSFLNREFSLSYGHKIRNKTGVPRNILGDEKLSMACFRGLIDTDGSVSRRGRNGSQFCVQFTSHNKRLLRQVSLIGMRLGIFTFGDDTGCGTNKWENILKYFEVVGSSNLRHVVRFNERLNGNTLYQREIPNYYQKDFYRNTFLPFKSAS